MSMVDAYMVFTDLGDVLEKLKKMNVDVYTKFMRLVNWFRSIDGKVMVMFSGGVDSSVVLSTATAVLGTSRVVAVTFSMPIVDEEDLYWSSEIAKSLGVERIVIEVDILSEKEFVSNPVDRCYVCKRKMVEKLNEYIDLLDIDVVINGTNASDLHTYRPGYRALREYGVRSPLAEIGITKEDSREIAKAFNLPNWSRASSSCLATRIPYGSPITLEKIVRIAKAERIIKDLTGLSLVRVRDHGNIARIEVDRNERRKFFSEELMDRVARELNRLGYRYVTLDLNGYRSGSFDTLTS